MWIWNFRNKSDSYSIYLTKELRRMKRKFNGCKNMRSNYSPDLFKGTVRIVSGPGGLVIFKDSTTTLISSFVTGEQVVDQWNRNV